MKLPSLTPLRSLQLFQMLRAGSIFLVSVFFSRLLPSQELIGYYEQLLLIGGSTTFFWVSGLINPLIPAWKSSSKWQQERLFFNTFLALILCSLAASVLLFVSSNWFGGSHKFLFMLNIVFNLFNAPAFLTEYIMLLRGKSKQIAGYGLITFLVQTAALVIPAYFDTSLETSMICLTSTAFLRFIFLAYYIKQTSGWHYHASLLLNFVKRSLPYAASLLLGGSLAYVDSYVINYFYDKKDFAIFRYGARELPFVMLLANAFSNAQSGELALANKGGKLDESLEKLKKGSARMMHYLFPLTIILLIFSEPLCVWAYKERFAASAPIFNIYLLLIISRLCFPQTILLSLRKNRMLFRTTAIEVCLNLIFDLTLVQIWGMKGVAFATVLAYLSEKVILVYYSQKEGISITSYFPIREWAIYSGLTIVAYIWTVL